MVVTMTTMKLICCLLWSIGSLVGSATAFQVQKKNDSRLRNYVDKNGNKVDCLDAPVAATATRLDMSSGVVVDIHQSTERDIGTMDQWAAAYGVQKADGFEYTSEDGRDISVMTTQDMPAGSPVLFVPNDLIWSSSRVRQELAAGRGGLDVAETLLDTLGVGQERPQFALFLKVLLEYEKGDSSPWFPWLNAMPRQYYNGASMTRKFFCNQPLDF